VTLAFFIINKGRLFAFKYFVHCFSIFAVFKNQKIFGNVLFSFHSLLTLISTYHHSCRCTSPDPIDNSSAMAHFDFENPIFQAEEEGDEDCELPEELGRLLKQEERVI
jgi:hypothetical protein